MASPAEEQVNSNYALLEELLEGVKSFLEDAEANPVPMFLETLAQLDSADIMTKASSAPRGNPSFAAGFMQEEVHKVEAFHREGLIRKFSKRSYYENAASNIERELEYLKAEKTKAVNYLTGKMRVQGR